MLRKAWFRNSVIASAILVSILVLVVLRHVLAPVFMALTLAYILDPVVDQMEERNIPRTTGIFIIVTALLLVMTGLALYLIPMIIDQIVGLSRWLDNLDSFWDRLREQYMPQLQQYMEENPEQVADWRQSAIDSLKANANALLSGILEGLSGTFRSIGQFLSSMLSLILVPVLAFYLLRDFDIMTERVRLLIPVKRREVVVSFVREMDQALGNFIKGQLLVALILSIIYTIGLWIAGTPGFLLIGIVAGFANLVPYLGIAVGFIPAVLLTYATGNPLWQIIVSAATFVVGQTLEGMVITPKIVGDSVGLHPVLVMVALMIGGAYFGLTGMILALPVSAVLIVVLKRGYNYYVHSYLYHEDEADDFVPGSQPEQTTGTETPPPLTEQAAKEARDSQAPTPNQGNGDKDDSDVPPPLPKPEDRPS